MTARRRGFGLITSSNFFVPQVNLPGSMASFVLPAGVAAWTVATTSGALGQTPQQMYSLVPNPTMQAPVSTTGNAYQYTPLLVLGALAIAACFMRKQ